MKFYSKIKTAIGNGKKSNAEDVINTRKNFRTLGLHSDNTDKPYIDHELDRAIRVFQREFGLREDGIINPGEESETVLNVALDLNKEGVVKKNPPLPKKKPLYEADDNSKGDWDKLKEKLKDQKRVIDLWSKPFKNGPLFFYELQKRTRDNMDEKENSSI